MILHKSNLPFIPPPPNTQPPPQYVSDSAKEVFGSARGLLDLMKGLTDWNVGIETPLVGYAIYVSTVFTVYAASFPHLDEERHLSNGPTGTSEVAEENANVKVAFAQLCRFVSRWNLGGGDGRRWIDGVLRLARFYRRVYHPTPSTVQKSSTKTNGTVPHTALLTREEFARYERMWRDLGRDESAGYVGPPAQPHPPPASHVNASVVTGGLAPPTTGKRAGGEKTKKERVSPQPQMTHTGVGKAAAGDRWHAINKSPMREAVVESVESLPSTASLGLDTSGLGPAVAVSAPQQTQGQQQYHQQPQAQMYPPPHNPSQPATHPQQHQHQHQRQHQHQQQPPQQIYPTTACGGGNSPNSLIDQFIIEHSPSEQQNHRAQPATTSTTSTVASPKKRAANEISLSMAEMEVGHMEKLTSGSVAHPQQGWSGGTGAMEWDEERGGGRM